MLKELIKERNLPDFKSKEEMLEIMKREVFGYLPPAPESIEFVETDAFIPNYCAGKATSKKVDVKVTVNGQEFSFPFYMSIPKKEGKHPFFVLVGYGDELTARYVPFEEIIDNGFAVINFKYGEVTRDNDDFTNGLAGILYPDGKRGPSDAGKIAIWSWAAQRVMDYLEKQDYLDMNYSAVCGHSRLGKTALYTAATDERFKFAYSNDSGCSGAALSRGKVGEQVERICNVYGYWFCENYIAHSKNVETMPFDQHYLTASIAPRYVYVASANEDQWADPVSEFLNCVKVGEFFEAQGKKGFICEDRLPQIGDMYHEGTVGYHLRAGTHYHSREDWQKAMQFIRSKMN